MNKSFGTRKRTSFPIKEYFQEFKNELKQSTKLWLVFLITLVVLVMDVIIVGSHNILALRFRNG
ncbi:DUF624 domain-containing protein [Eubacterium ventriosum]|uniref:DUF624 domain-containing protein n=1 Tax=Eubacterium ventriosum TaxID=39496 RepID=A0A415L9X0_9FIRM|nr:DUF624 domain-containing protein [Eubacterium ventriosum]